MNLFDFSLSGLSGGEVQFNDPPPKAVLLVNVASRCGLTPQYKHLESLWRGNQARGLLVVGLPCNQFGSQEPGNAEQIASFCSMEYGVSFPMTSKIEVNGPGRHPLYEWLAGPTSAHAGNISWNFEKFLIGRDGQVIARFAPTAKPDAPEVIAAIEKALG